MTGALVFTGHMIDAADRPVPRFPPACEGRARAAIGAAIDRLAPAGMGVALAGAASGGDILFHEACLARSLLSEIRLALPPDEFARHSVDPAGGDWRRRFDSLLASCPLQVLAPGPDREVWERCNTWMLDEAIARAGARSVTLLALWDEREGDGLGGTGHFLQEAKARGTRTEVIATGPLFGLAGAPA